MKRIVKILSVFILLLCFVLPVNAKEKNKITLYLFHGDGCPHCAEEEVFLQKYKDKINIEMYEVWYNEDNQAFMDKVREAYSVERNGVPLTIIGDTYFIGYTDAIGKKIDRAIDYYLTSDDYVDEIDLIKKDEEVSINDNFSNIDNNKKDDFSIKVPVIGNVSAIDLPVMSAAVLIGLVDGFNPCAMWVLLFLISILVGMKDKKRMWALGLAFLLTSAFVYMIIMFSWLNIVVSISASFIARTIIGIVAIIGGILNLRSYLKSQDSGCTVVDDKKRKRIFNQIKKFTSEKSFILALFGVMALAVSVNVIELACSAGLPLVFTQLLAINKVSGFMGFIYTLVYVFFFLIDDLVIFFIAMFTMNVTGISTKYNKYSHLIGGLLMLIIGLLLIFNYKVLTFGL